LRKSAPACRGSRGSGGGAPAHAWRCSKALMAARATVVAARTRS
jgi:hypothetical protein